MPHSRRTFLQLTSAASAALAFRIMTEPALAGVHRPKLAEGSVLIDSNENPLGPCAAAREAVIKVVPQSGRYPDRMTEDFLGAFAEQQGLKREYVRVYAGSSPALFYSVRAFTSPRASFVTADPGFELPTHAAEFNGARVVKVPLTRGYAHDVRAMLAAAPDAGLFYICTPNNPTGTLTSHADIEYLVEHKPRNSVVLVDEAYIHFSDATSAIDLARADRDVIVLRTFSKLYGMAGLRCGVAMGRPDLLAQLGKVGGDNDMPVTAIAAATASLQVPNLVAERKLVNAQVRQQTFDWLERNGYTYIPSVSNCFMVDTKRPAREMIAAMAQQKVIIGRVWPVMPTYARITVGTQEEMEQFQAAFQKVMTGKVTARLRPNEGPTRRSIDGVVLPS
ncbi:MAG TPA: pyridoxal phosphate-dependent aminotransferase [Aggregatilineaceae bacterium]|nr:pyridoxal phosphate-dependent aminotransferase [Aggregatilineaceae bacterium]